MKIYLPFKKSEKYRITQTFGADFIYRGKFVKHKGVDWAVPRGTALISPFNGKVVRTTPRRDYGYGKSVYIIAEDISDGVFEVLLAHCESIDVRVGQIVKYGDIVARSGRSGFWRGVTGYHLHLGLKKNNKYIDPLLFLGTKESGRSGRNKIFKDELKVINEFSHLVKKGDTLWDISKRYYGNGVYYNEIYAANTDILSYPKLIQPGQRLRIPKLVDKGV